RVDLVAVATRQVAGAEPAPEQQRPASLQGGERLEQCRLGLAPPEGAAELDRPRQPLVVRDLRPGDLGRVAQRLVGRERELQWKAARGEAAERPGDLGPLRALGPREDASEGTARAHRYIVVALGGEESVEGDVDRSDHRRRAHRGGGSGLDSPSPNGVAPGSPGVPPGVPGVGVGLGVGVGVGPGWLPGAGSKSGLSPSSVSSVSTKEPRCRELSLPTYVTRYRKPRFFGSISERCSLTGSTKSPSSSSRSRRLYSFSGSSYSRST